MLYRHHIGMPWDDLINQGLYGVLADRNRKNLEIDIEYLDLSRNPSEDYKKILLRMLELKYDQRQPDVIISNLGFTDRQILLSIGRILSGAKIISLNNHAPPDDRAPYSDRIVEFYIAPISHADHLPFIKRAMPEIEHIYFITGGSSQEQRSLELAKQEFDAYKSRFDFIYYAGLPLDELIDRIRHLQKNSAIIFNSYFSDVAGNAYVPAEVIERIHKAATAPIFGPVDTYLGRGIVGGNLSSAEWLGKEAGKLALVMLDHTVSYEVEHKAIPSANLFDWRELKRWNISEDLLPEGSVIRYREFSFFELYKWHLLMGACIVLIQSILIALLLVTLSRRKRAEKALSDNEKKYRRLVESLRDGVIAIDRNRTVTGFNTGAARIFGYREEDIIGHSITTLIPKDEISTQLDHIGRVMKDDVFTEYESTRLTKNGTPLPVRIILSALKNESDMTIGLIEIVRDISEQKLAEREKGRLESALQQAQKMEAIGTLAGGIAHDFNNILTAILGYTEFALLDIEPGTGLASSLEEVMKAGKRARDLVNQILTFARRSHEEVKPIDIRHIAEDALKLLRSTIPASIDIRKQIKTNSFIMAAPIKIHQIFMNICVNASHSMKNGGIIEVVISDVAEAALSLENHHELLPNDYLKISFSDTGSGIPENNLGMIFEPYFTTKDVGDGTGLGLSVVHGIVKSYGGEIFVTSVIDKGTVFTIYFPATQEKPQ